MSNTIYAHFSASASQVLSPNPGAVLKEIVLNTAPTGTGGTLVIYDDQAVNANHVIASINLVNPNVPGWEYNAVAPRGLFIVFTQGGTIAGDITITYQ
jgi:hypothetical protein